MNIDGIICKTIYQIRITKWAHNWWIDWKCVFDLGEKDCETERTRREREREIWYHKALICSRFKSVLVCVLWVCLFLNFWCKFKIFDYWYWCCRVISSAFCRINFEIRIQWSVYLSICIFCNTVPSELYYYKWNVQWRRRSRRKERERKKMTNIYEPIALWKFKKRLKQTKVKSKIKYLCISNAEKTQWQTDRRQFRVVVFTSFKLKP